MGASDWNWRLPNDYQDVPWDCSAASTAWCLRTIGYPYSEAQFIAHLGPDRISSTYGLLDASGAGLVEALAELGVSAENNSDASWDELVAAAGFQPMVVGGRNWCHWVAVRLGPAVFSAPTPNSLVLMNPAPGYMDVGQILYPADFERLGAFSAVWFTSW